MYVWVCGGIGGWMGACIGGMKLKLSRGPGLSHNYLFVYIDKKKVPKVTLIGSIATTTSSNYKKLD